MSRFSDTDWGSPVEQERRRRILVSVAAYAYEIQNEPLISDHAFDHYAEQIDVSIDTGRPDLDAFFRAEFSPMTGMWIRNHPELDKIEVTWRRYYHNVVLRLRR